MDAESKADFAHLLSVIAHNACDGHCRHDVGIKLMAVCDEYAAACNSADIMAAKLQAIENLCDKHDKRNSGLVGVSELRAILDRERTP